MRSFCLGSGSSGNCFYVESQKNKCFLVDLGFSFKRINEILSDKGVDIHMLDGVFLTHEHSDHCVGIKGFVKNVKGVKIYLTKGTFLALKLKDDDRFVFVKEHDVVKIEDMKIFVVSKSHDAKEPVSFVFENNGVKTGIFTDLGYVGSQIKQVLKSVDVLYLESNYCNEIIKNSSNKLNYNYVNRVLSDVGHLSLKDARDVLSEVAHSGQRVVLSHISQNTNSYENVYVKIGEMFEKLEKNIDFSISFQNEPTEWFE